MTTGDPIVLNDRYQIDKRIGRGGMADVFVARDLLLDRQVAIKVLFPEFATDPNFVERFRREAQAAANLSHPNIVNVYDWGKYSGTYFIAMEYVQGRTLADILRSNGSLTSKQAAEVASEVTAALGFAHSAGLVHRDVKPANILIGTNGQVKVADFGIARAMGAAAEHKLTQAGAVMGTATYFSPEQAQGAQPHPRSDLYSLGIVMYEMVAGKPPFVGDNPVSIAYKQVHDQPRPLNQFVADIPRAYEAIVARLLAKDPAVRYPDATALREDLRRFRSGEPVEALRTAAAQAAATTAMATDGGALGATAAMPTTGGVPATAAGRPVSPRDDVDDSGSRSGWYALAAFLALIALAIGGFLLFRALSSEDEAGALTLEDYTGRPLEEVTAALDELELIYQPVPEEASGVPEGVVHRTEPGAGTVVQRDRLIALYFNPEQEPRPIPDVTDVPLEQARSLLNGNGFRIGDTADEDSDDIEAGNVIRTDPAAGTEAQQGTRVHIVVSAGPNQVAVPSEGVIGFDETAARNVLENDPYNFTVSVVTEASNEMAEGLVIRTDPAADTLVPVGGNVVLVISGGSEQVLVPRLLGATEQRARDLLAPLGLSLTVNEVSLPGGDPDDGLVMAQSHPEGAAVDPGTTITVEIGRATTDTTAPPPATTRPPATQPPTTTTQPPTTTTQPPTTTTQPPTTTTQPPTTTTQPPTTTDT